MSYKKGIDVSHWEPIVEWDEVVASGYEFAFMKASQGIAKDHLFEHFWTTARNVIPRGAYHFYDPRYESISPKVQAEFFWELIKDDPGELPPVVDIELYKSGPWHGASHWYDFIDRFFVLSGMYPMIYTAYYYWIDESKVEPVQDIGWFAEKCKLWVANYNVLKPMVPPPWTDWEYWQYSEMGIVPGVYDELGRLTECDLNYYKGATLPEPEEQYMLGRVLVNLNIRSTAGVTATNKIGSLLAGDMVEANMKVNGWWSLTSISRNGTLIPLPATPCYAYEGENQGYIQTVLVSQPEDYIIHYINGEQHRYERAG